ncbi:IclR family transcriptional regulator domain-containing protein [Sodalis sp. (in: enterobacteria)]|uniref:IclR family transcriptional regulator domain-containing protein n=1 Tax=Sodalis sp. (in: enterobacteria) TaxID=1898979 RepID=UPI003F3001B5
MLHRDKVRIVDRFQSSAAAPAIYAVGSHLPAMNTAVGRALLACFSEREVIARLMLMPRQGRLGGFNQPGIVRLLQRLSVVRGQGWDFNRNKTRPGYSALATALADSERREQFGLCLSFVNAGDKGAFPTDKLAGLQSATRMIAQRIYQ